MGGRPRKAAKAEGVSAVASAGGGRPVILAKRVRSHRMSVKMPSMEPRVVRRLANCSATETIATEGGQCPDPIHISGEELTKDT